MLPDRLDGWGAPIQDEGQPGSAAQRRLEPGAQSRVERLFERTGPVLSWLAGILMVMTIGAQIYIVLNR
ncbi:MAG: hypothetical protein GX838_07070 [Clostridiaceae bacterium]|nr:hypothetical protein [Clostridiaceae bacterium]